MIRPLLLTILILIWPVTSLSHSGGTNANGCHTNHSTSNHHCHNSRPEGAYLKQMKGYHKSRSTGVFTIAFWLIVLLGTIAWVKSPIKSSESDSDIKDKATAKVLHRRETTHALNLSALPCWNTTLTFSLQDTGEVYLKDGDHIILMLTGEGAIIKHRTAELTKSYAGRTVGVNWLNNFYHYYSLHFMSNTTHKTRT